MIRIFIIQMLLIVGQVLWKWNVAKKLNINDTVISDILPIDLIQGIKYPKLLIDEKPQ